MQKVKLEFVKISNTKKDGTPYPNEGELATIKFDGKFASKYIHKTYGKKAKEEIEKWKAGDEVLIKIEQNGDFTNFDIPSKTDILEGRINILNERLTKLETMVTALDVFNKNI